MRQDSQKPPETILMFIISSKITLLYIGSERWQADTCTGDSPLCTRPPPPVFFPTTNNQPPATKSKPRLN